MENNEKSQKIKKNEDKSSKKIINEKDNNKDIIDIIEYKNNNMIIFKSKKSSLKINMSSLKKIFSLVSNKEQLEDMYFDHVTINILDFNPDNDNDDEFENIKKINKNSQHEEIELDLKYKTILEKANIFNISFERNLIQKNVGLDIIKLNEKEKTKIVKKSLKKIFKYQNKSIISMSDYINLVILYLQDEKQSDFAKLLIEQKILGKYSGETKKDVFDGKKEFNSYIKVPLTNQSQNIYIIDNLFNKVLDYIDDCEKESSFSDDINNLIIPRKNIDEDLIQTAKVYFVEEGILTDINSDKNNIVNKKEGNNNNINQQICNNQMCSEICCIF